MRGEDLEFKVRSDWKKLSEENPWLSYIQEVAVDENGQEFMRRRGNNVIYRRVSLNGSGEVYECTNCSREISYTCVAHDVKDESFISSELIPKIVRDLFRRTEYEEQVPYCPSCEKEPINGREISFE